MTGSTPATDFLEAADAFVSLCDRIGSEQWDMPGLGEWTLRHLVGHTLRAATTVSTYLKGPAPAAVACSSPGQYFAMARSLAAAGDDAVAARGRESGRQLGDEPTRRVREGVATARESLMLVRDPAVVIGTVVGGMRLDDYLPTRTFELTAHSVDIAVAAGVPFSPPEAPLRSTLRTTVDALAHSGEGVPLLRHLLGRQGESVRPLFPSGDAAGRRRPHHQGAGDR